MAKLRMPAMLIVFSAAAVIEAFRLTSLSSLNSADIWWHLSSGLWMLEHHALPHSGIFSQASVKPWIASSWAYDLLLAVAYKALGLRAIPWLLMCFKATLAVMTFVLAGSMRGRFWLAVGISVLAQYILGAVQPAPAYFSALFFGIELLLLLEARRSEDGSWLWWLPLLFLVWANLHVQFVYGVVVLLLFLGAVAIERFRRVSASLSVVQVGKVVCASLGTTVVTPYLFGPYAVFFKTTFGSATKYLPDFQALGFRQPQDYLLLLLAMAAFLTLGLRRSRDLFQIALLTFALGFSFYAQRDTWLVVLASLAAIGDALASGSIAESEVLGKPLTLRRPILTALGASVVIVILVFALRVPRSEGALLAKAGHSYPVAACDYIREHRLGQPLFNAYEWGGFLTWYLPEYPVAIDSRADLYGAETVTEYSKVMNAEVPYTEYPAVATAQTILLPKKANMAAALGSVPDFQVAYRDGVAVVLTRRSKP